MSKQESELDTWFTQRLRALDHAEDRSAWLKIESAIPFHDRVEWLQRARKAIVGRALLIYLGLASLTVATLRLFGSHLGVYEPNLGKGMLLSALSAVALSLVRGASEAYDAKELSERRYEPKPLSDCWTCAAFIPVSATASIGYASANWSGLPWWTYLPATLLWTALALESRSVYRNLVILRATGSIGYGSRYPNEPGGMRFR